MDFTSHHTEIPRAFYSDSLNAPFERCLTCDIFLLEDGILYVIEKAIRRYPGYDFQDTVFEYAMCLDCLEKMHAAMSEESIQRIQAYFGQRVDLIERRNALLELDPLTPQAWISSCVVKGTPISEMAEYQIYGQCDGDRLLYTVFPYTIGGEAIDEIGALLSNKTLGEIDGFMEDHFGLPPELRKLLLDNKMLFV